MTEMPTRMIQPRPTTSTSVCSPGPHPRSDMLRSRTMQSFKDCGEWHLAPWTWLLSIQARSQLQRRETPERSMKPSLSHGTESLGNEERPVPAIDNLVRCKILGNAWDLISLRLLLPERSTSLSHQKQPEPESCNLSQQMNTQATKENEGTWLLC